MAFSTQKDFFNLPFMNESIQSDCVKACVKLKSYESTIDNRSWASDEEKQSKFLSDLVTCQYTADPSYSGGDFNTPDVQLSHAEDNLSIKSSKIPSTSGYTNKIKTDLSYGVGDFSTTGNHVCQAKDRPNVNSSKGPTTRGYTNKNKTGSTTGYHVNQAEDNPNVYSSKGPTTSGYTNQINSNSTVTDFKDNLVSQLGHLTAEDSLLQCANIHLADYQKMLKIKTTLEKQLEVSNERLQTAKEENKRIIEILNSKLDSNTAKIFYNKIQTLLAAGKLNKNEENEMLQIYQKMENMCKAHEILQAENYYLKRIIEKLSRRVTLDNISTQPEKSEDTAYLQKEINNLRKECLMLRQMEDDYQRLRQQQQTANKLPSISEQDSENIKAIIKERNSLREKCKSFEARQQEVKKLEQKAVEANKVANELSSSLSQQSQYVDKIEKEMQDMQKYYEDKQQNACFRDECLKAQLEDLKDELVKAKCQAQKSDMLAMEVSCLRNELLKRDLALNNYDCQYKQLMDVVDELQSVKLQCLHDNQTQTFKDKTDELAFFTCATLGEILKELKKKGCLNDEFMAAYHLEPAPNDTNVEYEKQCCQEKHRLQQQLDEMKREMQKTVTSTTNDSDSLKRLRELEGENAKLLQENNGLNKKLQEGEVKMDNMLKKIAYLDKEFNQNSLEANKIEKDLQGTLGLVKDISEVQLKNQQLANAVSAINSRDDQKIIDDLRRQLEEEMVKFAKCQQNNNKLIEEAKLREIDLKALKEINNKLEAEKKNLELENKKLLNDNGSLENRLSPQQQNDLAKEDPKYSGKTSSHIEIAKNEEKSKSSLRKLQDDNETTDKAKRPHEGSLENINKLDNREKDARLGHNIKKASDNYENKTELNDKINKAKSNIKAKDYDKNKVDTANEQLSHAYQKTIDKEKVVDLDENEENANNDLVHGRKDTTYKKLGRGQQKNAPITKSANSSEYVIQSANESLISPHTVQVNKHLSQQVQQKSAVLDDFVSKKSDTLKSKFQQGRNFEKEFRNILEEFIYECGYCLCRSYKTKSKLYAVCHKLYHSGINVLSFRELAYLHKKIFVQAEQLLPGCLLDMILTDHKEQVVGMLTSVAMPRLIEGKEIELNISDTNVSDLDQKCCCCKNELCCNNSEEMLKDKVNKLERDIEIAREYLETLKIIPLEASIKTYNGDSTDTNNSTYRATSTQKISQKSRSSKNLKKLKARLIKHSDII